MIRKQDLKEYKNIPVANEKIDTPGTGSDVKISFLNDSAARHNVDLLCHCEVTERVNMRGIMDPAHNTFLA